MSADDAEFPQRVIRFADAGLDFLGGKVRLRIGNKDGFSYSLRFFVLWFPAAFSHGLSKPGDHSHMLDFDFCHRR